MGRMSTWTSMCLLCQQIVCMATASLKDPPTEGDSAFLASDRLWMLAVVASVFILLILTIFAIINCGDCYNSEVGSENHPATGGSGSVKWGGAVDYMSEVGSSANDRVLGAGFAGEVLIPDSGPSQHLPYPVGMGRAVESQGFQGYAPAGERGYQSGGAYNSTQFIGGSGDRRQVPQVSGGYQPLPGAHISPVMDDEPPPAYSYNFAR